MYPFLHWLGSLVTSFTLLCITRIRSSSTTSTLNALALDKYIPVPIVRAVIAPGKSAIIPPNIVSPVTAVSASNGVGSGLTRPMLALTVVDS